MRAQVVQNRMVVETGVRVTLPRINRIAACVEIQFLYGLAKRAVRIARVRAQFDHQAWPQKINKKHPKGNVLVPRVNNRQALGRCQTNGMIERIHDHSLASSSCFRLGWTHNYSSKQDVAWAPLRTKHT